MKTHVRCGTLFAAADPEARPGQTLVYDARGVLEFVGPTAQAPGAAPGEPVLDYSRQFVMPGLIDVHTHLAYGNAKSEEDIDLYSPLEFRTLRGMFFAQKVLAAGYTAICSPGDAGQISLSIRNAIRAGLFDGPRVMAAGPYITTHQGLTDWYPTWIGAPSTSIGKLVTTGTKRSRRSASRPRTASTASRSRSTASSAAPTAIPDRRLHPGRDRRHGARDPPARQQGGGPCHRPRGDALRRARRRRSDLPRLRPRRRMHRGDARRAAAIAPDPHASAQHHRFHPAARAGAPKGRVGHAQREYERGCRQPRKGPRGRRADADRHRYRLRGHALWRVACPRARALRRRSRLHPGRRAARRDRDQCAAS